MAHSSNNETTRHMAGTPRTTMSQPLALRTRERAQRSAHTQALVDSLATCAGVREREVLQEELILVNRTVATAVSRRYLGRGPDQDDLEQVASVGLVKAARGFDPTSGNDFLTYAVPTIRGELQRHFRDVAWAVRPTRSVQELQRRVRLAAEQLAGELGHEPSVAQVIDRLSITEEEYAEAMSARGCFRPTSLDQRVGPDDSTSLADLLPGVAPETAAAEVRVILAPALRRLRSRDRHIIELRFVEDLTQAEIGARIGVTQMQVSRLLTRILHQLRTEIGPEHLQGAS